MAQDPRLTRRAEDAVYLSGLVALSGFVQLLTGHVAGSVDSTLSRGLAYTWAAALVLFGGIILTGILIRDPGHGVIIERIGRRGMAGSCAVYAIATIGVFGYASLFAAGLTLGYGFACYRRSRTITQWLRRPT